jgi:hypothetical protein
MCCGLLISAVCPTLQPALALPTKQGRSPADTRSWQSAPSSFCSPCGICCSSPNICSSRPELCGAGQVTGCPRLGGHQPKPRRCSASPGCRCRGAAQPDGSSAVAISVTCCGLAHQCALPKLRREQVQKQTSSFCFNAAVAHRACCALSVGPRPSTLRRRRQTRGRQGCADQS